MSANLYNGSVEEPYTVTLDSETSTSTDFELLHDLKKFKKTSFTLFLHHALSLVNAVPQRESSTAIEEVQKDLEVCLTIIIAAMNNENNKSAMKTINDELNKYCLGYEQANRRQAFNSTPAANPDSDDFLLFMRQYRSKDSPSDKGKLHENIPDICCTTQRHILDVYARDQGSRGVVFERLMEGLTCQLESEQLLEWKHHFSCWESSRTVDSLSVTQPMDYEQDYAATPLKEYGHTKNYDAPGGGSGWEIYRTSSEQLDSLDNASVGAHPINVKRCAKDAANIFHDTFGRDYIMNVAINDKLLRVWYFDHESPIQTSAFNFIEDRPYFLLFLFVLQRFSRSDWGYIDTLFPVNAKAVEHVDLPECFQNIDGTPSDFTFRRLDDHFQAHHYLSLSGRATHVIYGQIISSNLDESVVVKLAWRKKAHFPESAFLQEATKRLHGQGYPDVCNYLPTLLGEKDFPEFSTDIIRRRLMIPVADDTARQPYLIVLPRYERLTVRTSDWTAFVNDYMALIYCHFMLWSVGIEHADISVGNLMWDPQTKKPKLCDFDLSHYSDHEYTGFKNTGTLMFMASDLLSKEAMDGKVKRLYRHDLESFVAVFIWVISRYNKGCVIPGTLALREWIAKTPGECAKAREDTYRELLKTKCPEHLPPNVWKLARELVFRCRYMVEMGKMSRLIQNYVFSQEASPDSDSEFPEFSEEEKKDQEKKWKHARSINVLTDFLSAFAPIHSSTFVQDIAKKITARIEFLDTLQKSGKVEEY